MHTNKLLDLPEATMRTSFIIIITLLVTSCVPVTERSIPAGYEGPRAVIKSTSKAYSGSEATLFYLKEVDGRLINNALLRAEVLSNATNSHLIADPEKTQVRTGPIKLKLVATRVIDTPPGFSLKTQELGFKELVVNIESDKIYMVKGEEQSGTARLWLENSITSETFE